MTDCRECAYGQTMSYNRRMCVAQNFPKPVEYMRHEQSDCGVEALLFVPKARKYAEFDESE